jgi:hypothetical protein
MAWTYTVTSAAARALRLPHTSVHASLVHYRSRSGAGTVSLSPFSVVGVVGQAWCTLCVVGQGAGPGVLAS